MLGGGQLGRYALLAARVMGYGTVVLDPDPAAPAGADRRRAPRRAVRRRRPRSTASPATCAVVTTEFENPPAAALERLAAGRRRRAITRRGRHRPGPDREKPSSPGRRAHAPFAVCGAGSPAAVAAIPAIVKTARLGYDGKGQRRVATRDELAAALARARRAVRPRAALPLDVELSVLVARRADGRQVAYPVAENHHVDGILDLTVVPARVDPPSPATPPLGVAIAEHLDYVGVLAVELFVGDGRLLVNELAPRPHNSGHWTLDAAVDEPVRAAGASRVRAGPRVDPLDARHRGDGQPARRPLGRRRAGLGGASPTGCPPPPVRQGGGPSRPQDGAPHRPRRPRRHT